METHCLLNLSKTAGVDRVRAIGCKGDRGVRNPGDLTARTPISSSDVTGSSGARVDSSVSSEDGEPTPRVHRFENYEPMLDEEGRPIELGRGAMGVTYKALDVDLRCPVTLKVINERYLDEAARAFAGRSTRRGSGTCRCFA
jgi:hypothetical protein